MVNVDMLLTIVGIVLVTIGVGVLLLGKHQVDGDGERRNVFEAFGIKLDVANPSVLLIMFGVVLMLTPRFVPIGENPVVAVQTPSVERQEVLPDTGAGQAVAATTEPATEPDSIPEASSAQAAVDDQPPLPPAETPPDAEQVAAAQREQDAQRAQLDRQRKKLAKERARLAAERARSAALETADPPAPVQLPTAPTASGPVPSRPLAPRLMVLVQAIAYEGESGRSMRGKLHAELKQVANEVLAQRVSLVAENDNFASEPRRHELLALCKRTQADSLLVADLMPVAVESFGIESANWPEMRYAAVHCASGRVTRSSTVRMEPVVGDQFPLQQSVARTARAFVSANQHLLQ